MSTASLQAESLLPRAPGGLAPGAALALLVHAGLIAALSMGIDWRSREPDVISAELWAAVPQMAAPPAPEPAPVPTPEPVVQPPPVEAAPPPPAPAKAVAPPEPDISMERERRKMEAERKKAERDALAERKHAADLKRAEDDKKAREQLQAQRVAAEKEEKAADARLAVQRQENLRRMLGQASSAPGAGTAAQSAAPTAAYAGKVKAAVRPNIVFTGTWSGQAAAEVEVHAAPAGSIISRKLIKSSGNPEWDEAVLRAIDKTRSMPRDTDGRVPATLIILFRPNE